MPAWYFLVVVCAILPRVGVMLFGCGSSPVFEGGAGARRSRLMATLVDLLSVTRYPPSLLFLAMALGPSALVCVQAEWVLIVALLLPLCRWVTALKARRSDWWLSYQDVPTACGRKPDPRRQTRVR